MGAPQAHNCQQHASLATSTSGPWCPHMPIASDGAPFGSVRSIASTVVIQLVSHARSHPRNSQTLTVSRWAVFMLGSLTLSQSALTRTVSRCTPQICLPSFDAVESKTVPYPFLTLHLANFRGPAVRRILGGICNLSGNLLSSYPYSTPYIV